MEFVRGAKSRNQNRKASAIEHALCFPVCEAGGCLIERDLPCRMTVERRLPRGKIHAVALRPIFRRHGSVERNQADGIGEPGEQTGDVAVTGKDFWIGLYFCKIEKR